MPHAKTCDKNSFDIYVRRKACRVKAIEEIETAKEWQSLVRLKGVHFKSLFVEAAIEEINRKKEPALRDVPRLLDRVYLRLCRDYEDADLRRDRARAEKDVQTLDKVIRFLDAAELTLSLH